MSCATFDIQYLSHAAGQDPAAARVAGEVDATNAAEFARALAAASSAALVIDLSGVGYLDSAGFAALDQLLSSHCAAVVISPGSLIRTSAQLVSLRFHDTVAAAQASLIARDASQHS